MNVNLSILLVAGVMTASASAATAESPQTPYAGRETRSLKALSSQEISDLADGKGMGLALAAELNGYPGPRHVLDLAPRLGLSADLISKTQALFEEMQASARKIGTDILETEKVLEQRFGNKTIDPDTLRTLTSRIGGLRSELRALHLGYHLKMRSLMSADQVAIYNQLRGYGRSGHGSHGGHIHK